MQAGRCTIRLSKRPPAGVTLLLVERTLVALSLVVLLALAVGLVLPEAYEIERGAIIAAEPGIVHELVGDLTRWPEWTVWHEDDPSLVVTLGEQTRGVGARQRFSGETGDGELTITASDPEWGLEYEMSVGGASRSTGRLRYERVPEGTRVTWTLRGAAEGVVERYSALFMRPMVGSMFERGLARLENAAEAPAAAR